MSKFIVGREKSGRRLLVKRVAVYGQGIVEEWTYNPAEAAQLGERQAEAVFEQMVADPASCDVCVIIDDHGRAVKTHTHQKPVVEHEPDHKLRNLDFGRQPAAVEPAAV